MLVDSHCHLDFKDFAGEGDAVIERARAAGIGHMLTICTHITRFPQVLAVAEAYPDVSCTIGIHPHEAGKEPETGPERLVRLAAHPKVVGFGETGLDYFYEHSPRDLQQASFRRHLAAARTAGLPVVVHTRDAEDDTLAILQEEYAAGPFTGLIHCFSASQSFAEAALKMGLYLSFSGIVTFKTAASLREIASWAPLERVLVETDAPYLAPIPKRGKRNEPAFVAHTAAALAAARGMGVEDFARATTANFFRLFAKATAGVVPCD